MARAGIGGEVREHDDGDTATAAPADRAAPPPAETEPGVAPPELRAEPSSWGPECPLLPPGWGLMAGEMLAMLVIAAIATLSLPLPIAAIVALGAGIAASAPPLLARLDQGLVISERACGAAMFVAVGAPMTCFGFATVSWAFGHWATAIPALGLPLAGAMLGATVLLATILLERRRGAVLAAHGALWLGIALAAGSWFASAVAFAGFVAAAVLGARQAHAAALDADRRAAATRRCQRAEAILTDFEESGQGWFWESDRRGALSYVSAPIAALLGREPEALVGRPITALFDLSARAEGQRTLTFHLSARSPFADLPVCAATPGEEEERWWSVTARPVHDAFGNFQGFRGSGTDLTERRKSQQHFSRMARSDALTGLANRVQMTEAIERILGAPREDRRACAVFLLDLDRFKQVNDTLGHPAGDALLKSVAQRLERSVDKASRVGRLGGDEFQVILPGRIARDDLGQLAHRIIETLTQPYAIDGHRVTIGASIGIAVAPDDGVTSDELVRNADLALYAAKDRGRGRHHFYSRDMHSEAERRRQIERDLREALVSGKLEVRYQPLVHTASERIAGFEALLHWHHPVLGALPPEQFIPIAEESELIEQIGEWVLRTACADLAAWPEPVRVAVNVSPRQFANPSLPAIVTSALAGAQVAADRLELEVTETVLLRDDGSIDATFAALKRLGVRMALDDFGTGYASLGYLRRYPFDKVKIDRSFVNGATAPDGRNRAIIGSIVGLAEALGMDSTAEGVETLAELALVRALGCGQVQGFVYQPAVSAAAAGALLAAGPALVASGPQAARASRQTTLRAVELLCGGERHAGTIRNVSESGALIECEWAPPAGAAIRVVPASGEPIDVIACWARDGRIGVALADPAIVIGANPRASSFAA